MLGAVDRSRDSNVDRVIRIQIYIIERERVPAR